MYGCKLEEMEVYLHVDERRVDDYRLLEVV